MFYNKIFGSILFSIYNNLLHLNIDDTVLALVNTILLFIITNCDNWTEIEINAILRLPMVNKWFSKNSFMLNKKRIFILLIVTTST